MTHRQVLAATAIKIIHRTVELPLKALVFCVCEHVFLYAVEHHVLLYESYVKCHPLENVRQNSANFPETPFQT
jgi:hypothetical protein